MLLCDLSLSVPPLCQLPANARQLWFVVKEGSDRDETRATNVTKWARCLHCQLAWLQMHLHPSPPYKSANLLIAKLSILPKPVTIFSDGSRSHIWGQTGIWVFKEFGFTRLLDFSRELDFHSFWTDNTAFWWPPSFFIHALTCQMDSI